MFQGANRRLPCEIETLKNAPTSVVAADQGIFITRHIDSGVWWQESVLQVPKDLARLESLLVMIDRWSLGYSCAVLLVGVLQVLIIMMMFMTMMMAMMMTIIMNMAWPWNFRCSSCGDFLGSVQTLQIWKSALKNTPNLLNVAIIKYFAFMKVSITFSSRDSPPTNCTLHDWRHLLLFHILPSFGCTWYS